MKIFKRTTNYRDTGEPALVTEMREEIDVGDGSRIRGLGKLTIEGRPLTAADDTGMVFKDLVTGRLVELKDQLGR